MIELEQRLVMPNHAVEWQRIDPSTMPRLVYLLNDGELRAKYPELCRRDPDENAPMTVPLITDVETFPFDRRIQEFLYRLNPNVPAASFGALFNTWFPGIKDETKIGDDNFISDPNYSGQIFPYFAKLTLGANTYMADGAPFMYKNTLVYRLLRIS